MTDDDGLEPVLKATYLADLRKALETFAGALGLNETARLEQLDAVSRLFVRYESFPAYSTWRRETLQAEIGEASKKDREEPHLPTPTTGTPEERGQNAFAAWKEKKLESAAYGNLIEALKVKRPSAVYQGRNGKWYISNSATAEDFAEAFR